MINTPIVGRIYHVVDKTTGAVIKVGSTIQSLRKRFCGWDYQKKYKNHFLKEVRILNSTDLDWYEPKNLTCPFMWHLVAAETLEAIRMNTFEKGSLSNQMCPLIQKLHGLGGDYGSLGGRISGPRNGRAAFENKIGIFAPDFDRSAVSRMITPAKLAAKRKNLEKARTKEHQIIAATAAGLKNIESGWILELGKKQGKRNAESGHCAKIAMLGAAGGHIRWHVNKGIISENCPYCKEMNGIHATTIN
jgi:hypothetical protein